MQFRNHHFGVSVATSSVTSPILASDPGRFVMSAQGNPPTSVGLSPTEASSVGAPKLVGVDTEARIEFHLTTSGAPTGASKRQAIFDHRTGRVGRWRGGTGFGIVLFQGFPISASIAVYHTPFPHSPSSNRTCGFPASGFRTKTHAYAHGKLSFYPT